MEHVPECGIYILVILVQNACGIEAGALGRLQLQDGYYAYVGRASRMLEARLARHARRQGKRLHWHIDYLLETAMLQEVWIFPLRAGECGLAARLEAGGACREGLRGFGASDCRCAGHLLYLGKRIPAPPHGIIAMVQGPGQQYHDQAESRA